MSDHKSPIEASSLFTPGGEAGLDSGNTLATLHWVSYDPSSRSGLDSECKQVQSFVSADFNQLQKQTKVYGVSRQLVSGLDLIIF